MNNNIENAIKEVFLECIKDSQIIDSLKYELSEDNRIGKSVTSIRNNRETTNNEVNHKLNELLGNQKKIIEFLAIRGNRGNDETRSSLSRRPEIEQNDDMISLKKENMRLKEQVQILKSDNEACKKEKQDILDKFHIIEESLEIIENIKMLSEDSRDYIYQLCGSDEFYALVSIGRDEIKINQLWHYLREQAVKSNANEKDVKIINNFFEFSIKVFNSTKINKDKYSFYEPMKNDEYNMEYCIRTSDSRQIGSVKEIIIRGVKQNEKIIFKSIVRID